MTLESDVRELIEPGWWPDFHGLRATLDALPLPARLDGTRFLDMPPVYVVGNLAQLVPGEFVLFTGLNPNSAASHRSAIEKPFLDYWQWCTTYFESADLSNHYRLHQAFLHGLLGDDAELASHAAAADISGLASTGGWPEEQVRLLRAPNARRTRLQLPELRVSRRHQTFRISANVFERLAADARCVVARYNRAHRALQEWYPGYPGVIRVGGRPVPLFVLPNDKNGFDPSVGSALAMGESAAVQLQTWEAKSARPG
jgi:hypothetical protein